MLFGVHILNLGPSLPMIITLTCFQPTAIKDLLVLPTVPTQQQFLSKRKTLGTTAHFFFA